MEKPTDSTRIPIDRDTHHDSAVHPFPKTFTGHYPAIVHAAVFTALVVPITLLPYFLALRRISNLRRTIATLETQVVRLKNEAHLLHAETHRVGVLAQRNLESNLALSRVVMKQNAARNATDSSIKADIQQLLDCAQHSRDQAAVLKTLGVSLADVAAFMQEVERDFGMNSSYGKDRRGIERLRLLAFHMQSLDSQLEATKATVDQVQGSKV